MTLWHQWDHGAAHPGGIHQGQGPHGISGTTYSGGARSSTDEDVKQKGACCPELLYSTRSSSTNQRETNPGDVGDGFSALAPFSAPSAPHPSCLLKARWHSKEMLTKVSKNHLRIALPSLHTDTDGMTDNSIPFQMGPSRLT